MRRSVLFISTLALVAIACREGDDSEVAEVDDGEATVIGYLNDDTDEIKEASDPTQIAGTNLTTTESEPQVAILYQLRPTPEGGFEVFEKTRALLEESKTIVNVEPGYYHILTTSDFKTILPPATNEDTKLELYTSALMDETFTAAAILLDRLVRTPRGEELMRIGAVDLGLVFATALVLEPKNIISSGAALTNSSLINLGIDSIIDTSEADSEKLLNAQYSPEAIAKQFSADYSASTGGYISSVTDKHANPQNIVFANPYLNVVGLQSSFKEVIPSAKQSAVESAKKIAQNPTIPENQAKSIAGNISVLENAEAVTGSFAEGENSEKDSAIALLDEEITSYLAGLEDFDPQQVEDIANDPIITDLVEVFSDPETVSKKVEEHCGEAALLTVGIECQEEIPPPGSAAAGGESTDNGEDKTVADGEDDPDQLFPGASLNIW